MSLVRAAMLWLVLFGEVRIHASSDSHSALKCDFATAPCVVEGVGRRTDLTDNQLELEVSISAGSVIQIRKNRDWVLIVGEAYLSTKKSAIVASPFGKFECYGACAALASREPKSIKLSVLEGDWRITRLGEASEYQVSEGAEVQLSVVGTDGKAGLSFPQSSSWDAVVELWARLYRGDLPEFSKAVRAYRAAWAVATESISQLHLDYALRNIANQESEWQALQAKRRAQERENRRLRQIFRQKNYLDSN